ncbi:hypothetical protein SAY86_023194 [Trapa natans]|uniref:Uncharacterized protein n=1 Tax=Trapa natans TaxID=22666 RepID=A0AAN7LVF5_TRANT|nr:hypothetical protein SAY86_023194 [Trapa natans]
MKWRCRDSSSAIDIRLSKVRPLHSFGPVTVLLMKRKMGCLRAASEHWLWPIYRAHKYPSSRAHLPHRTNIVPILASDSFGIHAHEKGIFVKRRVVTNWRVKFS